MNDFWYGPFSDSQLQTLFQAAMEHAAHGLSDMVGRTITINVPHIKKLGLSQISEFAGSPETEMVGVYLLIDGDFTGQVILMLPIGEACHLVDLLLDIEPGTTNELGELECSALAEVGNLTSAFFLNQIAVLTKISSRPSPPAVIVDMLGAIVDVVTTAVSPFSDTLMIAETTFQDSGRTVLVHFWVLPQPVEVNISE